MDPVPLTTQAWSPTPSARAFNTAYRNATSGTVLVSMAAGVAALACQGGRIVMEVCPDPGFGASATRKVDCAGAESAPGGTEIGFGSGLLAWVPPGHYYRWRTQDIGTAAFRYILNTGHELRLPLIGARTASAYTETSDVGFETARENTGADPLWVTAQVRIRCDPGDDGKLVLQVCPNSSFGRGDTREPSAVRLHNHLGNKASMAVHDGLKAVVPPGYFWRYLRLPGAASPTFTITDGTETTLVLSGVVCETNYTSAACPGMETGVQNTTSDVILCSLLVGQVSGPGDNGHAFMTISPDAPDLASNAWDVPYCATRNASPIGEDVSHFSSQIGLVPPTHWRKYRTSKVGSFGAPDHHVEGNEFGITLATGEFA